MRIFGRLTFINAVLFLIAAAALGKSYAQDYSQQYKNCISRAGGDDDALEACKGAETARVDAALNAAYNKLYGETSPDRRNLLQNSERLWIQFRDSECKYESSLNIGGPMGIQMQGQTDLRSECLLRETALRLQTLGQIPTR